MDIQNDVQEIFRDVFDDDAFVITRETSAKDIEDWDSIAQMNLVVAIEKHFHMRFRVEEIAGFQNVGEMLDIIRARAK